MLEFDDLEDGQVNFSPQAAENGEFTVYNPAFPVVILPIQGATWSAPGSACMDVSPTSAELCEPTDSEAFSWSEQAAAPPSECSASPYASEIVGETTFTDNVSNNPPPIVSNGYYSETVGRVCDDSNNALAGLEYITGISTEMLSGKIVEIQPPGMEPSMRKRSATHSRRSSQT